MESPKLLRFGSFEIDLRKGELRKGRRKVHIQRQPFDVLAILVKHRGELVSREKLRQQLWPKNVFVDFEHSLNRSISKLRAALGDCSENPRFIETLPGRGYRILAQVEDATSVESSEMRRIAVLPVENTTPDPENDYLAEGLTEALIDTLGRSHSGGLRVTAMASVLQFRKLALPIAEVAAELGVDLVLVGRLRQAGSGLTVRLELIASGDQACVWTKSYELKPGSQMALCDAVSAAVASAVDVETPAPSKRQRFRKSGFQEAHKAYLRGRYYWNQRTSESVARATAYFRYATEKDPSYPLPYIGLAESYIVQTSWGVLSPRTAIAAARDAAQKALNIDAGLAEAHVALGWARLVLDWNWPAAEEEFQIAISLNPSNPLAYHWYSYFQAAHGLSAESLDMNRRGLDLDPLSVPLNSVRGWLLYCAGRHEEAAAQCRRTCELEYSHPQPRFYLALAYRQLGCFDKAICEAQQSVSLSNNAHVVRMLLANCYATGGRSDEARTILESLERLPNTTYLCGYYMAAGYAALGMLDEAFAWLRKSCKEREAWTLFLPVDPQFYCLQSDGRLSALLQQLPTGTGGRTSSV